MVKPSMARRLREAREALDDARQARDDAIVAAYEAGGGMNEIGTEVGMSHVGVAKLLERLGIRKRWMNVEDANRELERRDRLERGEQ